MLAETHLEVSREFLIYAREQLALGNSLQASKKGWESAAHSVSVIAERLGWEYSSHGELFTAVHRISEMTGRTEIFDLFGAANALDQNFYEDWLDDEYIAINLDRVEILLDTLDEVP